MKKIFVLLFFIVTFNIYCDDNPKLSKYYDNAIKYKNMRDLKKSLSEINKAYQLITDKNNLNKDYINFLLLKSQIYSYFELLDLSEKTALLTTGLSDSLIDKITNSKEQLTDDQIKEIINNINLEITKKDNFGYHIALSFLYNILGNEEEMKKEQQKATNFSKDNNTVINISMWLYKVRGRKQEVYNGMLKIKDLIDKKIDIEENEIMLAFTYHFLGWYDLADKIAREKLNINENDLNYLYLKMNVEMSKGNYDEMKKYESKILKIDPNAFKEQQ